MPLIMLLLHQRLRLRLPVMDFSEEDVTVSQMALYGNHTRCA
jgi:hypothetical protein